MDHECHNATALWLKISWPGISNTNNMDFDFYSIEIKDEVQNVTTVTGIKTSEVSYMGIFDVSELAGNSTARVQVNAVNRCSNSSLYSDPLNIKGMPH